MRQFWLLCSFVLVSTLGLAQGSGGSAADEARAVEGPAAQPVIFGHYLELRSDIRSATLLAARITDVEELTLRGRARPFEYRAILGWQVVHGEWNGEDLAGLSVVAVVESQGPIATRLEGRFRTILLVDDRATEKQREALITLVRESAPRYTKTTAKGRVEKVRPVQLKFEANDDELRLAAVQQLSLEVHTHEHAGDLCHAVCGKDPQPQRALSRHVHTHRAVAKKDLYSGQDLPVRWSAKDTGKTLAGKFGL